MGNWFSKDSNDLTGFDENQIFHFPSDGNITLNNGEVFDLNILITAHFHCQLQQILSDNQVDYLKSQEGQDHLQRVLNLPKSPSIRSPPNKNMTASSNGFLPTANVDLITLGDDDDKTPAPAPSPATGPSPAAAGSIPVVSAIPELSIWHQVAAAGNRGIMTNAAMQDLKSYITAFHESVRSHESAAGQASVGTIYALFMNFYKKDVKVSTKLHRYQVPRALVTWFLALYGNDLKSSAVGDLNRILLHLSEKETELSCSQSRKRSHS